jgi:uncharacterized protein (DUF305 family)
MITLGAAFAATSATAFAGGGDGYTQDGRDDKMEQGCEQISGESVDRRFARWMLIHHQAAIEMAYEQIERGQDEELKKLAEETIAAEGDSVDQLREWLKTYDDRRGFRYGNEDKDDSDGDRERR